MTSHAARLAEFGAASTALALLSDHRLGRLLDRAPTVFSGIGGTAVRVDIGGTPVFVKRVPLTDLERRPEHVMSTANLFRLPNFYQYGVGSAGFGVWRELAAHVMTTNWVLEKRCASFPLLYHWRVLPGPPPPAPTPEQREELARMVDHWDGSPAVRERLEAIGRASASVVLFLEYVPQTVSQWLKARLAAGELEPACAMVERGLRTDIPFMNANGLIHFDAHFGNILTDGRRLYFADFGLATSPRFELSADEERFLTDNESHDSCLGVTQLVNWLVAALGGAPSRDDRIKIIQRYAEGGASSDIPLWAAATIRRYAPVAAVVNEFYGKLLSESKAVGYPVAEIERACAQTGIGI
jgi:hypothetical protein